MKRELYLSNRFLPNISQMGQLDDYLKLGEVTVIVVDEYDTGEPLKAAWIRHLSDNQEKKVLVISAGNILAEIASTGLPVYAHHEDDYGLIRTIRCNNGAIRLDYHSNRETETLTGFAPDIIFAESFHLGNHTDLKLLQKKFQEFHHLLEALKQQAKELQIPIIVFLNVDSIEELRDLENNLNPHAIMTHYLPSLIPNNRTLYIYKLPEDDEELLLMVDVPEHYRIVPVDNLSLRCEEPVEIIFDYSRTEEFNNYLHDEKVAEVDHLKLHTIEVRDEGIDLCSMTQLSTIELWDVYGGNLDTSQNKKLTGIEMSFCGINIDVRHNHDLHYLKISFCPALKNKEIDLSYNVLLEKIIIGQARNLKKLNLSKLSELTKIRIYSCDNIKSLDLSENEKIDELELVDNRNLENVKLPLKHNIREMEMTLIKRVL